MRLIPLILSCALQVSANTESVFFSVGSDSHNAAADPNASTESPMELDSWLQQSRTESFGFDDESLKRNSSISIKFLPTGRYWARVCWPASRPADMSIGVDSVAQSIVVQGTREEIVKLAIKSYDIQKEVPFQVHVSLLKWGFLPLILVPVIFGILMALVLGVVVAYIFVRKILR